MLSKSLQLSLFMFLLSVPVFAATSTYQTIGLTKQLSTLEKSMNINVGLYAFDTNTNQVISYRADERFPVQSTFKLIAVGALLHEADSHKDLLTKNISYTTKNLVSWSPVTRLHVVQGMTLSELSEAAISFSDNTAINLIMKQIGGTEKVTAYARELGNQSFNVAHYEANLNSNPNKAVDTATPKDMAMSMKKLILDNTLSPDNKQNLLNWMLNNTTGYQRIRAGVPSGWRVADKTGSGSFGIANDIGLIWSPACKPIILAIYTVSSDEHAHWQDDVLAKVTNMVFTSFAKSDDCIGHEQ